MEEGGAHLGLSLPVSVFHHRWSFSCAGSHLHSRAPFSFAGVVFIRGGSPWFMGSRPRSCSWAFTFVHGWASMSMGSRLRSWAFVFVGRRPVMPFVWCCGGCSCSFVGGRHRGRSCRWWGAVVGSWWGVVVGNWWGVVASCWCVVVVGPHGCSWWSSRVVVSLLWLRQGSRWCM